MIRNQALFATVAAAVATWIIAPSPGPGPGVASPAAAQPAQPGSPPGDHGHMHAPVPAAYASAHIPVRVWTDPKMIARGKEIYTAKCALCHGERGDGQGPGAASLPLRPADLTAARMVAEMAGNYWFWRVSEGGLIDPWRSKGSAMPAWKAELSIPDRWAVIAYAHTFSGHHGPHTPAEHPEMGRGHAH